MAKSLKVDINAKLLKFARERVGLSLEEVQYKTKFNEDELISWENGDDFPRLTQLRKIANLYKRAIAFFLLPDVPAQKNIPKEFRTISSEKGGTLFTYKTWLSFNRAIDMQFLAKQLSENIEYANEKKYDFVSLRQNPETLAENYRKLFDLPHLVIPTVHIV